MARDDPVHDAEVDAVPRQASLDALRQVLTRKEVNAVAERSNAEGLKQSAFHGCCIAATAAALALAFHCDVFALEVCAFLAHAYVLSFVFMPLHEAVHKTAFKNNTLNLVLAWVAGTATMRPPRYYLLYHYQHHKHTGDPDKDPELAETLTDFAIDSWGKYLLYLSSIPFWYGVFMSHVIHACGTADESFLVSERTRQEVIGEARRQVAFYCFLVMASVYFQSSVVLWYWFLPTLCAQPFLRFYLLAEHHGCTRGENMLINTRTTDTYWWYRKLAWNMPYHAEHHAWPNVPFHRLGAIHDMVVASKGGRQYLLSGCDPNGERGYFSVNTGLAKQFPCAKSA